MKKAVFQDDPKPLPPEPFLSAKSRLGNYELHRSNFDAFVKSRDSCSGWWFVTAKLRNLQGDRCKIRKTYNKGGANFSSNSDYSPDFRDFIPILRISQLQMRYLSLENSFNISARYVRSLETVRLSGDQAERCTSRAIYLYFLSKKIIKDFFALYFKVL